MRCSKSGSRPVVEPRGNGLQTSKQILSPTAFDSLCSFPREFVSKSSYRLIYRVLWGDLVSLSHIFKQVFKSVGGRKILISLHFRKSDLTFKTNLQEFHPTRLSHSHLGPSLTAHGKIPKRAGSHVLQLLCSHTLPQ